MALRPFVAVPEDLREWSRWMEEQAIIADDDSVTTAMLKDDSVTTAKIKDKNVTYAKIQDVTADRILGRLTSDGVVSEMTAAQVFAFIITQQSNITDASTAHALNATFSDTEVEAALDALGTKINAILSALDGAGITA